ncbi:hypothetical protein EVAR_48323_1, partial [Eumeta japonica]
GIILDPQVGNATVINLRCMLRDSKLVNVKRLPPASVYSRWQNALFRNLRQNADLSSQALHNLPKAA